MSNEIIKNYFHTTSTTNCTTKSFKKKKKKKKHVTRKIKFGKILKSLISFLLPHPHPHSHPHASQDQIADGSEDSVPPIEIGLLTMNEPLASLLLSLPIMESCEV